MAPEDWQGWLRTLHPTLWKTHRDPSARILREWANESRRLTTDEWGTLQDILREHKPICTLANANWGFGCGMSILAVPPHVYPGADTKPERLLSITKDHLPLEGRTMSDGKKMVPADRTHFEDGWTAFTPFTHSEENARLLKEYGLEPPKSKGHYEY